MSVGKLKVICGPMYAGKTTALLHSFYKLRAGGRNPVIIKPAFDDRYGVQTVTSHDGLKADAYPVRGRDEVLSIIQQHRGCRHVLFDEAQFFISEHYRSKHTFHNDVLGLLATDVDISCFGLDCDWRGEPFHIIANLLAMADEVIKLTAFCSVCGEPASKTAKIGGSDSSIELGGVSTYEARCTAHWSPNKILGASGAQGSLFDD